MAYVKKVVLQLSIILLLHTACCTEDTEKDSKEELVESESKDGNLEIIKQIKKVNDDGSYTIGYEADDGSFKIESRDVLGNIKGTYGYIDDSGQIKRVSYSTTNSSEVLNTKPEPTSSVVQKIPKQNRTHSSTTKRPAAIYSTTQSTPVTTPRRRTTYSSTTTSTTEKPNYSEVINVASQLGRTTSKPHVVYATSAVPRILLSRAGGRSTVAPHLQNSEGQLSRPETVTISHTDLPLFKRLALKNPLLEETLAKPVVEESQIRSNILRRELSQDSKGSNFDPQQHVYTLQQALGDDSTDVYSASVTTGTPRPLFTTTLKPRILSSTTVQPVAVPRPTIRYPFEYLRSSQHDVRSNGNVDYNQEASSTETPTTHATPTPIPVVQIPANRPPTPEPLVAIRHPFQRGTILIPLSQIQGRLLPIELNDNLQPDYQQNQQYQEQYVRETTTTTPRPTEDPRPVYVRRLPPPHLRPVPVHVDENGYVRDLPHHVTAIPTPYPLPVPVTPSPKQINNDITNDIDSITPPVSTKDFHRLLHFLIMRQKKLELVRDLAFGNIAPQPEYRQPYQQAYQPTIAPYYVSRGAPEQQTGPVQFIPAEEGSNQRGRYLPQPSNHHQNAYKHQRHQQHQQHLYNQEQPVTATPQSYVPTRRVARLLSSDPREQRNEEFLPPDVREMLLLKMLQLAINPALPVNVDEDTEASTASPQYKKVPVRNVEILGEESDEDEKRPARSKRFRNDMDYYE